VPQEVPLAKPKPPVLPELGARALMEWLERLPEAAAGLAQSLQDALPPMVRLEAEDLPVAGTSA
jgi:hypothetical protein